MKTLILSLCVATLLTLAGCTDQADIDFSGGNGGGDNNGDLRQFVLNNCNSVSNGAPRSINGASFPDSDTDDPTQSVYTQNCLNQ